MEASVTKLPFAKTFWELLVYQKAFSVSLDIDAASLGFPKHTQYGGVADQMRRASKSICANIAEGYGKSAYSGEWRRFLLIALGSAQEMQAWCDYVLHLDYVSPETAREWDAAYVEIGKML